jgi:hypothetical protein
MSATPADLARLGVRVEVLAKEMQMIVAADRWKGRDLSAAPPEKWHRLRPETQQFWIDEAARILNAALSGALIAEREADWRGPMLNRSRRIS